jgi:hypothetical protein
LSAVQLTAPRSFFPPKHIDKIGTVQDAGLLENDPVLWALSEMSVHYPHSEEPDFVVSLGTGEPGASNYDAPTSDCRGARGNGMLRRFCDLLVEKSRDKPVRRACKTVALAGSVLRRIHRLNVSFPAGEPRLDDVSSIPELIRTAQHDPSLTSEIDVVARRMIASLFYFELTLPPQWYDGKYVLSGRIRCSIPCGDVAFEALLSKVSSNGGRFFVNDWVIPGMHGRSSFLGKDGNFEVQVSVETTDRFAITVELGDVEGADSHSKSSHNSDNHISGSPFSVQRLVAAQGLDAPFGLPDHRKRKAPGGEEPLPSKRRRMRV